MRYPKFMKSAVCAATLAFLGAAPFADPAAAGSKRGQFSHSYHQNNDRDDQQDARDNRREIIEFAHRGDIRPLPRALKSRLLRIAKRPHTYLPQTLFSEAADQSLLFQYYLLDTTSFQPNVFTSVVPGINETAIATAANAANGGLPTIGAVRIALEPKPGLPTDPDDPRAFIDIFTDISGLFVINNEAGWYEG